MHDPNVPVLTWPPERGDEAREVWYGLVSPQDASLAFWFRYTLLSTVSGHQEGRLWAAVTDREGEDTTFVSEGYDFSEVSPHGDPFSLDIGEGRLTTSSAEGTLGDVSWDLSYDPDTFVFTPLRSRNLTELLYRVADSGKHWSRNEAVRMSGTVTVGDRTIELENAPGHQGHTLGSSPPTEWAWVQCNDFEDPSVSLECLSLDGTLTMCLRRAGEVHPLNRLHHVAFRNRSEYNEPGRWKFRGRGEGVRLTASVEADEDHWQKVAYMAPDETRRYNAHSSLSTVTLTYRVDGGETRTLESDAGRAEWVRDEKPIPGEYRPGWEEV